MKYINRSTETTQERIEKIEYMITRFERFDQVAKIAKAKAKLRRLRATLGSNTMANDKIVAEMNGCAIEMHKAETLKRILK